MNSTQEHDIGMANECPNCQEKLGGLISVSNRKEAHRKPKVGDFSVCSECGTTLRFGEGLYLKEVTDSDIVELAIKYPEQARGVVMAKMMHMKNPICDRKIAESKQSK